MTGYEQLPAAEVRRAGQPVTFGNVLAVALAKYATGKGRASRSEYWLFTLWQFLFVLAGAILYYFGIERVDSKTSFTALFLLGSLGFAWCIIALVFSIPSISMTIRRLHDSGKSAHYIWFMLIPGFGAIFELVFMLQTPDKFANKYGLYQY